MKKRIGLHGFLIFLAAVSVALFYRSLFPVWKNGRHEAIVDALGFSAILFGFLVRINARGYKAELSSSGRKLITNGLYAFVRNPMYSGTFLIGAGVVAMIFKWWLLIVFLAVFLAIYLPQVRLEEKILSERFGEEYKEYCRRTPRFFPHLARLLISDPRAYLRFKWEWIKKELSSLIAVIAVTVGIDMGEDRGLSGAHCIKELLMFSLLVSVFAAVIILCYDKARPAGNR
jgi:protein-S-isoprenylcysteine O-methyltransferase Ste14